MLADSVGKPLTSQDIDDSLVFVYELQTIGRFAFLGEWDDRDLIFGDKENPADYLFFYQDGVWERIEEICDTCTFAISDLEESDGNLQVVMPGETWEYYYNKDQRYWYFSSEIPQRIIGTR